MFTFSNYGKSVIFDEIETFGRLLTSLFEECAGRPGQLAPAIEKLDKQTSKANRQRFGNEILNSAILQANFF